MTRKLYYEDVYMKEFTAKVVSCEADGPKWKIVLDQTAFYPEGGGQPADQGTMVLMGDAAEASRELCASCCCKVEDVHEKDGQIVHTCDRPMEVGSTVCGMIDWERRFDHMQQHSGEHIVSGMICSHFNCSNVGFHLGPDVVTIDFDTSMTWEDAEKIEEEANAYIVQDHPLEILWPSEQELAVLEYRSKKELHGDVRIVKFDGADICACCGTHLASSGQVNLVKIITCQKYKKGVRLEMLAGQRARRYLTRIWKENQGISHQLSAKPTETAEAVEKLHQELLKSHDRIGKLQEAAWDKAAEEYRDKGDVLIIYDELTPDDTRKLCDKVAGTCGGRCIVFAGSGEHYNYAVIAGAPRADEVKSLVKELNAALDGRGGGRDGWAQGSVHADEAKIRDFIGSRA